MENRCEICGGVLHARKMTKRYCSSGCRGTSYKIKLIEESYKAGKGNLDLEWLIQQLLKPPKFVMDRRKINVDIKRVQESGTREQTMTKMEEDGIRKGISHDAET